MFSGDWCPPSRAPLCSCVVQPSGAAQGSQCVAALWHFVRLLRMPLCVSAKTGCAWAQERVRRALRLRHCLALSSEVRRLADPRKWQGTNKLREFSLAVCIATRTAAEVQIELAIPHLRASDAHPCDTDVGWPTPPPLLQNHSIFPTHPSQGNTETSATECKVCCASSQTMALGSHTKICDIPWGFWHLVMSLDTSFAYPFVISV